MKLTLENYLNKGVEVQSPSRSMEAFGLKSARCLAFKPELFAEDFSDAWEHLDKDPGKLARWLERNVAVVAAGQFGSGNHCCNVSLESTSGGVAHYRQNGMGRTGVLSLHLKDAEVLLEVKGCGVEEGLYPQLNEYKSGLLSLECAVHEYLISCALDRVSAMSNDWQFSRIYALLMLDFQMAWGTKWIHAAILVREPTVRFRNSDLPVLHSKEWEIAIEVEFTLRNLALTSCFSDMLGIKEIEGQLFCSHYYTPSPPSQQYLWKFLELIERIPPFYANRPNVQINLSLNNSHRYKIIDFEHFKPLHLISQAELFVLANRRPLHFGGLIPLSILDRIVVNPEHRQKYDTDFQMVPCSDDIFHLLKYAERHGKPETFLYKLRIFEAYLACCKINCFDAFSECINDYASRW